MLPWDLWPKWGLAARPGQGPVIKLERVSLPGLSVSCRDQLSPSNPHCNPSCPPFCGLGQLLESQGFAGLSILISHLKLPQTAGLVGRWGREVGVFASFGTVGLQPAILFFPVPFLQRPILSTSKVRVHFPAPFPHCCPSPATVIVVIYAPKHPLSSAGEQDPKRKPFKDLCQAGKRIPPSEQWCWGI